MCANNQIERGDQIIRIREVPHRYGEQVTRANKTAVWLTHTKYLGQCTEYLQNAYTSCRADEAGKRAAWKLLSMDEQRRMCKDNTKN